MPTEWKFLIRQIYEVHRLSKIMTISNTTEQYLIYLLSVNNAAILIKNVYGYFVCF